MAKELRCPSCFEKVQPKADGSVVCAYCGGTFVWKEGEARLADVAEFDKLKSQVESQAGEIAELKKQLGTRGPAPAEPPKENADEDL